MSANQWLFFLLSLIVLFLASLAAQFNWVRSRLGKRIVYFITGVLCIGCLWVAGLPPKWFDGTKVGFGLGLSFAVGAWVPGPESERSFRLPLFLGIGLTLLVVNVFPHLSQ
ncbi:MAG TPA: hypothetical protein VN181_16405 [Thermoanaerobaculia bacterium]|nr:hypothetical protein [Thermoanaerobaculia bacterium]